MNNYYENLYHRGSCTDELFVEVNKEKKLKIELILIVLDPTENKHLNSVGVNKLTTLNWNLE